MSFCLLISGHTVNKGPYGSLLPHLFTFFVLSVGDFGVRKQLPEPSAEVLSGVTQCKKAGMCLAEKMCVREASFRHEGKVLLAESTVSTK